MKKRVIWGVVCWMFLCIGQPAFGAKRVKLTKKENNTKIKDSELAMKPAQVRGYAESWNLWSWNKAGYNVYALLVTTRMVFGTQLGVQLTIRTPDGKVEHKMVEYGLKKFRYKKKWLDILVPRTHRITFQRNKGFLYISFKKGWGVRLKFKRLLHGYRLQRGPIYIRKRHYVGLPYAPRISVEGYIKVRGKKIPYKGIGYADHSWQDMMPHVLAKRWYAARGLNKDYTVIATHLLPPGRSRPNNIPGLSIAKGNKWIFRGNYDNLKFVARNSIKDPASGYKIPQRIIYRGKYKGVKVKVDIKHIQEYDKFDILSQFNRVIRFIVQKLISKPFLFRYKAKMKVSIKYKDGKKETFTTTAYTEWTFLNK